MNLGQGNLLAVVELAQKLGKQEAHVITVSQQTLRPLVNALRACLSQRERLRASQFATEELETAYVARTGFLRCILSEYLKTNPKAIKFNYNGYGKPSVASTNKLEFNMSHSEDLILYAITTETAVGIDIEKIKNVDFSIVENFFSNKEITAFKQLPEQDKSEAFFHIWAQKEAFIKAIGEGLSCPLDSFSVSCKLSHTGLTHCDKKPLLPKWFFSELEIDPDYKACIALRKPVDRIEVLRLI